MWLFLLLVFRCSFLSLHNIFNRLIIFHYCVELSLFGEVAKKLMNTVLRLVLDYPWKTDHNCFTVLFACLAPVAI